MNKVVLKNDVWYRSGKFESDIILESKFVWTQQNLNDEISKKTKIIFKGKSLAPRYDKVDYKPEVPPNLIDERWGVATNDVAKTELQAFNIHNFQYPKPVSLVKYLISFNCKNDSIVLDFFAGTGTTLQSVAELNEKDEGERQCILVSNNEVVNDVSNKICEEVTYKRASSIIQGYTNSKGEWVPGLTKNNLRYYKTEFVDSAKNEENRRKLTQLSGALLQIKEDCYEDVVLPETIAGKQAQAFTNGKGKYLLVVYHHRKQTETSAILTEWIKQLTCVEGKIKLYAFSPETEILMNDFIEVAEKIDPVPLPDAIYNAYRNIFRTIGLHKRGKIKEKPGELIENETDGLQTDEQNLNH